MNLQKERARLVAAYEEMGALIQSIDRVIAYTNHTTTSADTIVVASPNTKKTKKSRMSPEGEARRQYGYYTSLARRATTKGDSKSAAEYKALAKALEPKLGSPKKLVSGKRLSPGFWGQRIEAALGAGHTTPEVIYRFIANQNPELNISKKALNSALERSDAYKKARANR